jgi:hypothetical protein
MTHTSNQEDKRGPRDASSFPLWTIIFCLDISGLAFGQKESRIIPTLATFISQSPVCSLAGFSCWGQCCLSPSCLFFHDEMYSMSTSEALHSSLIKKVCLRASRCVGGLSLEYRLGQAQQASRETGVSDCNQAQGTI